MSDSITIPAKLLQDSAHKESVRNLNALFQKMGGKVVFKTVKGETKVRLVHPNPDFLEDFQIKLYKELGLEIEEKEDDGEERKTKQDAETLPGIYQRTGYAAGEDIPSYVRGERSYKRAPTVQKVNLYPVVKEAVKNGAIDDGQIVKLAADSGMEKKQLNKLRKYLSANSWTGKVHFEKVGKRITFEDVMRICASDPIKCDMLESPFKNLAPVWKKTVDKLYGKYKDKNVTIQGQVVNLSHRSIPSKSGSGSLEGRGLFQILISFFISG